VRVITPRTSGHPYIETIHTYYRGCNTHDVDLMMSTFTDDVVHYFVDHSAVRGADGLANYWAKIAPRTQANWVLDHALVQEPEAVIEWYLFRDDKIAEIRSYHNNYFIQDPENRALHGFDYSGRTYRT